MRRQQRDSKAAAQHSTAGQCRNLPEVATQTDTEKRQTDRGKTGTAEVVPALPSLHGRRSCGVAAGQCALGVGEQRWVHSPPSLAPA